MLGCVNCKKDVDPSQAKLFAETFVCPDCFKVAERFMQRAIFEANQMLLMMKEAIRIGLIRGELQFMTERVDDMKPGDLFQEMSRLAEKARAAQRSDACGSTVPTLSSPPSLPGVSADGKRTSS